AHLKDLMNVNGVILVATAKDPNNHAIVLGIGVVPFENFEHWQWFLKHLRDSNLIQSPTVIISDRQKGLIKACTNVYPDALHRYCLRHIVANIRAKGTHVPPDHEAIIYKIARADSNDTYTSLMEQLNRINPGAAKYLCEIDPTHWVTYLFTMPTFDNLTSNLADSANNWLGDDMRSSDIVQMHFKYLLHMLKNVNNRRSAAEKWPSDGLTPVQAKLFDELVMRARRLSVYESHDTNVADAPRTFVVCQYDVNSSSPLSYRLVELQNLKCQCGMWFDKMRPCVHAIASMIFCKINPLEHYPELYSTDWFKKIYSSSIVPVPPLDLARNEHCTAPVPCESELNNRPRGRRPEKRKKVRGMDGKNKRKTSHRQ
ncbi:hypothetical protein AeMF1_005855, partial [Aphanomyces euteiches]